MSEAVAVRFITEANQNPALRDKVKVAGKDKAAVLRVAKSAGYDFTEKDFQAANKKIAEMRARGETPLAEDELDMISGGDSDSCSCHPCG